MSLFTIISVLNGSVASSTSQLSAPTLSLGSQSGADFILDWNDITGNNSYTIQQASNIGFSSGISSLNPSASTQSYSEYANGTYYFRVKALGNGTTTTDSDWSNIITVNVSVGEPSIPFDLNTATQKIVKTGGTVGVDCDYTSITAALTALTGVASVSNQFKLLVKNGTYNENGQAGQGLALRNYVHIIGESRDGVIIYGPAASPGSESINDVIHVPATCLVQDVTLYAYDNKYPVHCDYNLAVYDFYMKNVKTDHLHSNDGYIHDIGFGLYGDQKITIINHEGLGGGLYGHNNDNSAGRNLSKHFELTAYNSSFSLLQYHDFIEYSPNVITLTNNTFTSIVLNAFSSVYDANPGVPTCNNGTKVYTEFINSGNTVTSLSRNTEAATILGTTMDNPTDFN